MTWCCLFTSHKTICPREYIHFGLFSGLTINWDKSMIIPLTLIPEPPPLEYPLLWSTEPVKYLGVWLHHDPEIVIKENYGKACVALEQQVDMWSTLPLSLADRIAIKKMIVLPWFLYLFSNIPIKLSQQFFKTLRTLFLKLIWRGRQARIGWHTITLDHARGKFCAPDFYIYYLCAQAQYVYYSYQPHTFTPHVAVEDSPTGWYTNSHTLARQGPKSAP